MLYTSCEVRTRGVSSAKREAGGISSVSVAWYVWLQGRFRKAVFVIVGVYVSIKYPQRNK